MNVDLCFVPATHQAQVKLPAVSGSSGKLVVEPPKIDATEAEYPGLVFANPALNYVQAMTEFVAASEKDTDSSKHGAEADSQSPRFQKQKLHHEEEALRAERSGVRERRKQEDGAWQALKAERRAQQEKRKVKRRANKRPPWGSQTAENQHFKQLRQQRRAQVEQRAVEDRQWRRQRKHLRFRLSQLPLVAWIAILVITDNCTRQCLGLPMFVAGPNVTAEMVVDALRRLLPAELHFLISDRGPQFRANLMKQLALDLDFIHVVIARHRPQSNGIAERFVRTLKEWLADKSWLSYQQLAVLLDRFQPEYNDRPHQGLPIPGLSPNEFANRSLRM